MRIRKQVLIFFLLRSTHMVTVSQMRIQSSVPHGEGWLGEWRVCEISAPHIPLPATSQKKDVLF